MFELMIVEIMKMDQKNANRWDESGQTFMRPVQIKPSLMDRVLRSLGEALIWVGLKLKDRPHTKLTSEQSHAPNYLIML
jgi:hypothetical protein